MFLDPLTRQDVSRSTWNPRPTENGKRIETTFENKPKSKGEAGKKNRPRVGQSGKHPQKMKRSGTSKATKSRSNTDKTPSFGQIENEQTSAKNPKLKIGPNIDQQLKQSNKSSTTHRLLESRKSGRLVSISSILCSLQLRSQKSAHVLFDFPLLAMLRQLGLIQDRET